jgi:hypothetical protein
MKQKITQSTGCAHMCVVINFKSNSQRNLIKAKENHFSVCIFSGCAAALSYYILVCFLGEKLITKINKF